MGYYQLRAMNDPIVFQCIDAGDGGRFRPNTSHQIPTLIRHRKGSVYRRGACREVAGRLDDAAGDRGSIDGAGDVGCRKP